LNLSLAEMCSVSRWSGILRDKTGADNSVPNGECLAGGCKAGVQRIDNTMTTTATPLECYAIKVQQRDGTERVLYNVSSKQVAMQIVDQLNRNPQEVAWYEQRSPIGVK